MGRSADGRRRGNRGEEPPAILYVRDLAQLLGRTEKAIRHATHRGKLPAPIRLAGRLAWQRAVVLSWLAERSGVSRGESTVNITATPYDYDRNRFRVTFEIPKSQPDDPRRRVRKVAPAGVDHQGALEWARKQTREVWRTLMEIDEEETTPKTAKAATTIKNTNTSRKIKPHHRDEIEGADAPTLDDFWPRFEDGYLRQMKPSTRRGYDSIYRNYLRPVLGEVPLGAIGRRELALLRERLSRMKSPGARNQVLCKLRAILNTAARWHVIADEHIPKIRTEKTPPQPDLIVLTEEEASRLLSAAEAMGNEETVITLLLLHGGLRISEVAALRWMDIDLEGGLMTIRHNFSAGEEATPKGAKAKPVGLTPPLAEALRRLPRKLDFVLTRRYRGELTHQTAHSLTYRLHKIQERAGLRKTGAHQLRHSCLTILAQRGGDPWRLQAHARHARIQTTQRYVHLAADIAAREAAAFWEGPAWTPDQTRPKRPKGRVRGDLTKN